MRPRVWMTRLGAGLLLLVLVLAVLYLTATRWIAGRETESGETLPAGVPGRLIRLGGHRVHVVESGAGPAILLVHGTAGTTLDWETSVLDDLARDHHVIALDLYGMGFSDRTQTSGTASRSGPISSHRPSTRWASNASRPSDSRWAAPSPSSSRDAIRRGSSAWSASTLDPGCHLLWCRC